MSQENVDRQKLKDDAVRESAIADMKQHADKLIQGFEAEDKTHSRRAIWELIQNARDLAKESEIVIELTHQSFEFTHNGKPFTSKTLLSLIKQVSSKSDEKLNQINEEEIEEVGQYGTGFITTHTFGKRFKIQGSLKVAEGTYITLENFEINRIAPSSLKLADLLVDQQNAVFNLLKKEGNFTGEVLNTTFTYEFDEDQERENASDALKLFTEHYIPIVMALNKRVKSLSITNRIGEHQIFFEKETEFEDEEVVVYPIKTDGKYTQQVYTLLDKKAEIAIILPLEERYIARHWEKDTGRLFLYFPLIGTEDWGCNYIIHCGKFSPTEKRDGLHLNSTKSQTKAKEESNRKIIDKASEMVFAFLKENEGKIANPINLAPVAFKTKGEGALVNDYYKELKKKWVDEFKTIKLVETDVELIAADKAKFFSKVFCGQPDYKEAIYAIIVKFWKNTPRKNLMEQWTDIVTDWEDESITVFGIDDVAKEIMNEEKLEKFDSAVLIQFYRFLISIDNLGIFDDFKLLPNIKGDFTFKKVLHTAEAIHPKFIEIADVVVAEVPQTFVLKSFELTKDLTPYTRKQISQDWNAKFIEHTKNIAPGKLLDDATRNALIELCSTFPSLDKKAFRGEIMDIIIKFYELPQDFIQIPNIADDEVDYDVPLRCLLKHFLYTIYDKSLVESAWVETNLILLNDILSKITGSGTSQFEETIKTIPIFPDQNCNLKVMDLLQLEDDMPEGFKELYKDVFSRDLKNDLVHSGSATYLPNLKPKSGPDLAVEMNDHFEKNGLYTEILKHPYRIIINRIIKNLTGKHGESWMRLFPVISGKRETIMMSRVTKKEVKESMFNILDLEEDHKITALGELAKDENMILIIQKGKDALALEQSDQSDFDFKKGIGVHIELLLLARIREELNGKIIKIETLSKQDGQDIVIHYGEKIIYYIEVKSRWSSNNVVSMSRNQIIQAVRHLECYTLCVVELANFYPDAESRHYPSDIAMILHLIRAVPDIGKELKPLIENALNFESDADAVKLTGDYRATVPKKIYDDGLKFEPFIDFLDVELVKIISRID